MRKYATDESVVENGRVALPLEADVSGETTVVVLPDLDPQRTYKVMSPRLVHPKEAKDFFKELVEESPDGP
jgi:hypothetical protein